MTGAPPVPTRPTEVAIPGVDRYWHVLFYAILLATTVFALTDRNGAAGPGGRRCRGAGTALLADDPTGRCPLEQPRLAHRVSTSPDWRIAFLYLTTLTDAYFTLLWAVYPQAFAFLGFKVGSLVIIPITLLWTWRQGLLDDLRENPENLLVVFGSVTIAMAMGAFIWRIVRLSENQQSIIAELEETRADLVEVAAAKGALEERERLAREIHDTLAQGFTGVVMQLEAAEQELELGGDARPNLDSARSIARHSLDAVRRSVSDLRPDLLDDGGLPEALRRTTARVSEHWSLAVDAVVTGDVQPLHPGGEVALLRVVQEALANVTKHASASRARVTLTYLDDEVTVDIRDDGAGFDPTAPLPEPSELDGGFGLVAMRGRVADLGGTFAVESEPGVGTSVMARLPLDLVTPPPVAARPSPAGNAP